MSLEKVNASMPAPCTSTTLWGLASTPSSGTPRRYDHSSPPAETVSVDCDSVWIIWPVAPSNTSSYVAPEARTGAAREARRGARERARRTAPAGTRDAAEAREDAIVRCAWKWPTRGFLRITGHTRDDC